MSKYKRGRNTKSANPSANNIQKRNTHIHHHAAGHLAAHFLVSSATIIIGKKIKTRGKSQNMRQKSPCPLPVATQPFARLKWSTV